MGKIANYLQSHVSGEVSDSLAVRKHFSTDASVLEIKPALVVYPRTTNDVRKVVRFSWQLAEKGHVLPITPRGSGSNRTGAALSKGVVMVFPAYLNKILELDTQQKLVRIQPGVNFKSLQETLNTHGLFLPPAPTSSLYSTVGGAIANNSAGDFSFKYGSMSEWVDKLEVVLANGELIQTGRISKKEVEKKKGLATLEGDIYRAVDGVLSENEEVLSEYYDKLQISRDGVGYNLKDIKKKDGSIDLTQLFVGSQGTLGVITEAILKVATHNPRTALLVAAFDSMSAATESIDDLRSVGPASIEAIDKGLIDFAEKEYGRLLPKELSVGDYKPAMILFAEFDDDGRSLDKKIKKATKKLHSHTDTIVVTDDYEDQEKYRAVRGLSSSVINHSKDGKTSVPVIDDVVVPHDQLSTLLAEAEKMFASYKLPFAVWGHAGDANIHVQPNFDLSKLGDRQKMVKLMGEYYKLIVQLGGSIAGEGGDGRLIAPFARMQVGEDVLNAYEEIKKGFDPKNLLNPGTKVGTDMKQMIEVLRKEYSTEDFLNYLAKT